MIEVFKTNVRDQHQADILIEEINRHFNYHANFDLKDCDNILRVKYYGGIIQSSMLIDLLNEHGFLAEILPEEVPYS